MQNNIINKYIILKTIFALFSWQLNTLIINKWMFVLYLNYDKLR